MEAERKLSSLDGSVGVESGHTRDAQELPASCLAVVKACNSLPCAKSPTKKMGIEQCMYSKHWSDMTSTVEHPGLYSLAEEK